MVLNIQGLIKIYDTNRALNGLDLQAEPGDIIGILGSSGSGKTTLINVISGAETVSDGKVFVDGATSVITNENALVQELTIRENIQMAFGFKKNKAVADIIDNLLKQSPVKLPVYPIGITTFDIYVISIMKSVVTEPGLILIDDFFSRCGYKEKHILWELLLKLASGKKSTIIFTTDDRENLKYAGRKYRLSYGKLYEEIS